VLFQLPDRPAAIREALRILKPGGMLLVIDWKESFNNMGPASHDVFPEADAKRLLEQCGLGDIASHEVGMYHYAITAKKSV
jgi:ubiquinone/menaquinone biosynthesis C-methylase UbiE